jgi:hypothetical protein
MSTRVKEMIALAVILLIGIICYVGKIGGRGPITLSTTTSLVLSGLVLLSLIYILIRTIQGKPVDRRTVFVYVGIAVSLPFLMTLEQTITPAPEVIMQYESLQSLTPGSKVLISFDYDPSSAPELQPMAIAVLRYCFQHDLKPIIIGLWPQGPQQAELALEQILTEPDLAAKKLQRNIDFANLGFQSGNEFVIQRMGSDFKSMFAKDHSGTPYEEIPLVKNVKNFSNVDYSFNLSAGYPGTREWVQVAVDRFDLNLGAGNTAVQAPEMYVYVDAGQLSGLLGGMTGAAEFESLVKMPGKGTKFMLAQSFAHMVVIAFIIIGNVAFFMGGRKQNLSQGAEA